MSQDTTPELGDETPELDAGEPLEEPTVEDLLERLKELEVDFDTQIADLRKQVDDLLERVTSLESDEPD